MTMNPDGTDEKVLVGQGQVFDYEWSPDGNGSATPAWTARSPASCSSSRRPGRPAQNPPRNITRFATYNGGVTWSKTGNKLAFISQRRGNTFERYVLSLQKPAAAPGHAGSKDIDWDDIHLRVKQPSAMNISECAISSDGSKIAFRASSDDSDDLWVANADGGSVTRLTTGNLKPTQIQWSRYFPSQIYFRDGTGNLRAVMIGGPAVIGPNIVPFTAKMTVRQDELFLEMFDQSWRALNENFYDPQVPRRRLEQGPRQISPAGQALRHEGRPVRPHQPDARRAERVAPRHLRQPRHARAGDRRPRPDLRPSPSGPRPQDRRDPQRRPRRPARPQPQAGRHHRRHRRHRAHRQRTNVSKLLNDKVGETVVLQVVAEPDDATPNAASRFAAEPRTKINDLMYERWIKKNADRVAELSKGKLGYIHIPSMDEAGLERFVRALYSDNFDKDGIVLDVRYNGGGFTHDQVLNYLTGKEHTIFSHRDGSSGLVLRSYDRKWTKPLTLLINNRSYSDAEIFPHAFRTWGLGKLVGQPTGGFVIGTRNITLIDGSTFRTPRIGVHTVKGVNMEKEGVMPDILIEPHPDQLARGIDVQLEKAVEVLRGEGCDQWTDEEHDLLRAEACDMLDSLGKTIHEQEIGSWPSCLLPGTITDNGQRVLLRIQGRIYDLTQEGSAYLISLPPGRDGLGITIERNRFRF